MQEITHRAIEQPVTEGNDRCRYQRPLEHRQPAINPVAQPKATQGYALLL
jgi:hypothetical protein